MKSMMKKRTIAVFILIGLFIASAEFVHADTANDIAERTRQIEELQAQIDEYQRQIDATRGKSTTLESEVKRLNAQIGQLTLQIRSLETSIDRAGLEIKEITTRMTEAERQLGTHQQALGEYLKLAYENDQRTLTQVILAHATLSEFFNDLNNAQQTQENIRITIDSINRLKEDLGEQKDEVEDKKSDLEKMRRIQDLEKRSLDSDKSQKNKVLKETKGQESKFQELIKKSTQDITRLKEQIYYLQQNGVSVEDAVKYGQLSAIRAGIRPAFLLAILEVESRLGQNVGSGNWKDDMYDCYYRLSKLAKTADRRQHFINRAESEKAAFFKIIGGLGLNPDSVKVSREPNYGCGGAMGPAQFIPTTWLGYSAKVTEMTGHNPPNPWNIEDAFMASAIKLASGGASSQTRAGEDGAARAYIGGSRTCSSSACNYYASAVLRKAAEIEKDL